MFEYLEFKPMFELHGIKRKIKHAIIMLNFLLHDKKKFETEMSVCSMVKNEANYIKEWIEFHKLVGVQKFYIYDNESDDNTREILEPYIKKNEVVYHICKNLKIPDACGHLAPQIEVFWHCIKHYRNETKYLAIIDIDEFLVPIIHNNLQDALKNIKDRFFNRKIFTGVCCRWVMFGTNGHNAKPDGLVIENYKSRFRGSNPHCKSIVNPRTCIPGWIHESIHFFRSLNLYAIDQNGDCYLQKYSRKRTSAANHQIFSQHDPSTYNEPDDAFIRCHHYYTKSYEEYKMRRMNNAKSFFRFKQGEDDKNIYETDLPPFEEFSGKWKHLEIEDTEMSRFLESLKERLR